MRPARFAVPVLLAIVAASALALAPASPAAAAPVSITIDGATYDADDTNVAAGARLSAYSGAATTLDIPETVTIGANTYDVVRIGNGAFDPLGANTGSLLTSVTLPSTLTLIDPSAFARNSLTSIVIPDSVTMINNGAFYGNPITSASLGTGLQYLGATVFEKAALTSIVLPDSLVTIGNGAFIETPLASVTFGSQVQQIGVSAFRDTALTSVVLPASVTSIGDYAFSLTPTLTDIRLLGSEPATGTIEVFGTGSPTISFFWRDADPQTPSGYTTPTWLGYPSQAIATVNFDGNGGTTPASAEVVVGDPVAEPAAPTRTGFALAGWATSVGGSVWDFASPVSGDLVLVARWAAILPPTGSEVPMAVVIGAIAAAVAGVILLVAAALRRRV